MGDFRKVSRQMPCPICGKHDWCGWMPTDDFPGGELLVCKRDIARTDQTGHDGQCYTFISAKTGNSIYELTDQWEIRRGKKSDRNTGSFVPKALIYEDRVDPLPDETLNEMYRFMMANLILEREDEVYFVKEGWPRHLVNKYHICSFPEDSYYRYVNRDTYHSYNISRERLAAKMVTEFGDLTGLPGAKKNHKGIWTFSGLGGIVFPVPNANGQIIRLRIRIRRRFTDGKGNDITKEQYEYLDKYDLPRNDRGKYHNLSSYSVDPEKRKLGIVANRHSCGCESGNVIGFYYDEDIDDFFIAYATEGEKKCMRGNDEMHVPFINIPGVDSFKKLLDKDSSGKSPVDYMKELGIHVIILAFDADKSVNSRVMDCEKSTVDMLLEEGFQVAVANWNIEDGKGIDDLIAAGLRPVYTFVR